MIIHTQDRVDTCAPKSSHYFWFSPFSDAMISCSTEQRSNLWRLTMERACAPSGAVRKYDAGQEAVCPSSCAVCSDQYGYHKKSRARSTKTAWPLQCQIQLIPSSMACRRNGWLCSSLRAQAWLPSLSSPVAGALLVMQPTDIGVKL